MGLLGKGSGSRGAYLPNPPWREGRSVAQKLSPLRQGGCSFIHLHPHQDCHLLRTGRHLRHEVPTAGQDCTLVEFMAEWANLNLKQPYASQDYCGPFRGLRFLQLIS